MKMAIHKHQLDRNKRINEVERGSGIKQRGSSVPQPRLYLCCCVPFMHHPESSMSAPAPEEIN